jgi:hypothetical protein
MSIPTATVRTFMTALRDRLDAAEQEEIAEDPDQQDPPRGDEGVGERVGATDDDPGDAGRSRAELCVPGWV